MSPFLPFDLLDTAVNLLIIAVVVVAILGVFNTTLYNRLSTRITVLIFASGLVTLVLALAFNEITRDTLSPPWLRQLQIASIVLGGPVVLGLLAARFVQRPLRQFHNAVASLKQSNYKVKLQPTGIREFDEVFMKFNNLIKQLRHEEKLRKDLVSDTSHELNTPLTTMIGQLTAMQEDKHPITKERITELKEQAERLTELVEQLDAYTKARMPASSAPEAIRLKDFCEELLNHFDLELKQKGIVARLDIANDYILHADVSVLQRIFTNLIQNALRYSEATEITISATTHHITFSDNGKGVPPKSLPYLFERFYRVDKSRSRSTGGLGLGLAIVRELAEGQGWHMRAENAHPGLTFILTLR
ncbi:MAG TPA: HAMP domain-containing sensor histidine kinase [Candidatus Saccharimonadales bacterium]|nr:HAMP domain-containing sensor histidine kinase [Candidatus Saccharimonadales bacterium]